MGGGGARRRVCFGFVPRVRGNGALARPRRAPPGLFRHSSPRPRKHRPLSDRGARRWETMHRGPRGVS